MKIQNVKSDRETSGTTEKTMPESELKEVNQPNAPENVESKASAETAEQGIEKKKCRQNSARKKRLNPSKKQRDRIRR